MTEKIIKIIDVNGLYKIHSDNYTLGRITDNNSLLLKIVRPVSEVGHLMRMKLQYKDIRLPDIVFNSGDEVLVENWITRFSEVGISFEFEGSGGYIKNSNKATFSILETIEGRWIPAAPIPQDPFSALQDIAFAQVEETENLYIYKNMYGDVLYSVAKSGGGVSGDGMLYPEDDGTFAFKQDGENKQWVRTYDSIVVDEKLEEKIDNESSITINGETQFLSENPNFTIATGTPDAVTFEEVELLIANKVDASDERLTNARPASDVPVWAKKMEKPSYTILEIEDLERRLLQIESRLLPEGGRKGENLVKGLDDDYAVTWNTTGIEKLYSKTVSLTEGVLVEINLPTSIVGTNIGTRVFIDGVLVNFADVSATGNKVSFIPRATAPNATVSVIYGGNEYELPTNYQYIDGEFTIPSGVAGIEIVNIMSLGFGASDVIEINWGDGNVESWGSHPSHTYATAGTYNFQVVDKYGVLKTCTFHNQSTKCLSKLSRYEGTAFTGLGNLCSGQPADIQFAEGFRFETPNVTSIGSMFANCGVTVVPADIFSECTEVTAAASTFSGSSLVHLPAGLLDSCTKLTTVSGFIKSNKSLLTVGEGLFRNKHNLTTGGQVFYGCNALETVGDYVFAGCENLTDVNGIFTSCTSLRALPENMLRGCVSISTLLNFSPTCTSLTAIPPTIFNDCHEVTTMDNMFKACANISHIPAELFVGMNKVKTAIYALNLGVGCLSFGAGLLNPLAESLETATNMVRGNTNMEGNINDMISVPFPKLNLVGSMFHSCKKLTGSAQEVIDLFALPPATTTGCFNACSNLTDYTSMPAAWK